MKHARALASQVNTAIVKQSTDREFRFAQEGVRDISAVNALGIVGPNDVMAVAFTVSASTSQWQVLAVALNINY